VQRVRRSVGGGGVGSVRAGGVCLLAVQIFGPRLSAHHFCTKFDCPVCQNNCWASRRAAGLVQLQQHKCSTADMSGTQSS
jgi:hypothetical protein